MFRDLGWWFPSGEAHMNAWMKTTKGQWPLNGRPSYQGRKQSAAFALCTGQRRRAIDVGAHVGMWSWNLGHWFQHVEAFEPVEAHRACFEKNVTLPNVTLYPLALGQDAGSVSMVSDPHSSGDTRVGGDGDIPMRTLDSFGFVDVDLIKIDTEGFEENVLRGGLETLRASWPVICVEQKRDMASRFGLRPQGAVQMLVDMGYVVAKEISGDFICIRP